MGAETLIENANLAIWNTLSRTDPAHTKQFSRAGGFKGTAIKPIWIVKMLTEQFGACGEGWGMGEPQFHWVPAEDEALVYCTVACWHTSRDNVFYGVGGEKVISKRRDGGLFADDEAYKKAFTDAVGNAFKFVGVGADVHMGLFDDSKYVAAVRQEFEQQAREDDPPQKVEGISKIKAKLRLLQTAGDAMTDLHGFNELLASNRDDLNKIKDANHSWWTGDGEDFEGFKTWIVRRRAELAPVEDSQLHMLIESMKGCDTLPTLTNWLGTNESIIDTLDDIERRKFEAERDLHESGIMTMDRVSTGA